MINDKRIFAGLGLFLLNQAGWLTLVKLAVNERNSLFEKNQLLHGFGKILVEKAELYAPEIFEDEDVVRFLTEYEFNKIVSEIDIPVTQ